MSYYDALTAKWATLTGTTAAKLAAVNALTVAGPAQDVPASAVLGYLALAGKLAALQAYASNPPTGANTTSVLAAKELFALFAMPAFETFQMSNSAVYAAVSAWLAAFVVDTSNTGITATDEAALLALATTTIPWWQASVASGGAGLTSPITEADLAAAGGLS